MISVFPAFYGGPHSVTMEGAIVSFRVIFAASLMHGRLVQTEGLIGIFCIVLDNFKLWQSLECENPIAMVSSLYGVLDLVGWSTIVCSWEDGSTLENRSGLWSRQANHLVRSEICTTQLRHWGPAWISWRKISPSNPELLYISVFSFLQVFSESEI